MTYPVVHIQEISRVVTDDGGSAIPYGMAVAKGLTVDVIFIREDGWILGAPAEYANDARRTWEDQWAAEVWIGKVLP